MYYKFKISYETVQYVGKPDLNFRWKLFARKKIQQKKLKFCDICIQFNTIRSDLSTDFLFDFAMEPLFESASKLDYNSRAIFFHKKSRNTVSQHHDSDISKDWADVTQLLRAENGRKSFLGTIYDTN